MPYSASPMRASPHLSFTAPWHWVSAAGPGHKGPAPPGANSTVLLLLLLWPRTAGLCPLLLCGMCQVSGGQCLPNLLAIGLPLLVIPQCTIGANPKHVLSLYTCCHHQDEGSEVGAEIHNAVQLLYFAPFILISFSFPSWIFGPHSNVCQKCRERILLSNV